MNTWQRFWQCRSRKAHRRVRRRIAAVRFRRLRCEQFEPRVVLAAPVVVGEFYSTPYGNNLFCDSTIKIDAAHGVLANDFDADGDPITALLIEPPANGTFAFSPTGAFTFAPRLGFQGSTSFRYLVSDGTSQSAAATATISVPSLGDPPVPSNDSYFITEDIPRIVATPGVLANDADTDLAPLTAVFGTAPAHGALILGQDGSFTYTPSQNFNGTDSFLYRATDGISDCSYATVTLNVLAVNDPPVARGEQVDVTEDTPRTLGAPGVLSNDDVVDTPGFPPPIASLALGGGPVHAATFSFGSNGSFTYFPNLDFASPPNDSFTYRAVDAAGATSGLATVTLNVQPINDAPEANNDYYATREDRPLTIVPRGVLLNDLDVDADSLTVVPGGSPQHGALSLAPGGGFTYFPADGFTGLDSFTYRAFDGMLNSNTATVYINVQWCQWCDFAGDDQYTATEDVPRLQTSVLRNALEGWVRGAERAGIGGCCEGRWGSSDS